MKTKEEILDINLNQKEFYNSKKKNFPTKVWSFFRSGLLSSIRKEVGVQEMVYNKHKDWLGDLSSKRVLDLGCYSGNYLSKYIAENAKEYVGIDLSDIAIEKLKNKLIHLPNAKAVAVDFLSDVDFPDKDFDIIYAYGVLHHFQNVNVLIERLNQKLVEGGLIISYDPLETSLPVKLIRWIYRPFQSDKDWEWPFTRKTFNIFNDSFDIIEKRGVIGNLKWFFLIKLLPISNKKKLNIGKSWHNNDWEKSAHNVNKMFSCMHLTMLMRKKSTFYK